MISRRRDTSNRFPAAPASGFTMVELLTVIVIIMLLVSIIVPSVGMAIKAAKQAKTQTWVTSLSNGCQSYFSENRNLYPGQHYPSKLNDGTYSGSQVLAAAMYGWDVGSSDPDPSDKPFVPYRPENVGEFDGRLVVIDAFSDPRPIVYYPSRLNESGLSQFEYGDNDEHTGAGHAGEFNDFIKDERQGGSVPHNDGQVIIFSAGKDAKYFGDGGKNLADNIPNWGKD